MSGDVKTDGLETTRDSAMVSRRAFLGKTGAAMASMTLGAPLVFGQDAANPFRIALIGCGGRMKALLGPILNQSNVEIVACADIDPKNLNMTLDRIERVTGRRPEGYTAEGDYEALLARDDVHGAVSACPCDLHAGIYLAALYHDKHIYGEKPLALTMAECETIRIAEREAKSILQIGFQRRASPRYIEGVARIHAGEIGEPIEARAAWSTGHGPIGVGGWLDRRERSGDWMLEQACHAWDVLYWVTGELPAAAGGAGRRGLYRDIAPDRDVTDAYAATLEYGSGFIATFHHSSLAPRADRGAFSGVYERIAGREGGIDLAAGRVSWRREERRPELIHPNQLNPTASSIEHFFDCVREGRAPASSIDNGIAATATGLLVRKAVDERRRVEIDEILQA